MAKRDRDPLREYNARRNFSRTDEPAGLRATGAEGNRFIVQKHAATRLHWDLRLEIDGVLKSWAVTKGPSSDPDVKRLAVRTEDHPLAYADFEGTIPAGEYGGGTVMLWDRGTWWPQPGKSAADLDEGHLHFRLDGQRMKGEWLLVRLKPRAGEKRDNWLLRKLPDEYAAPGDALVTDALTSVATGRTMAAIASGAEQARTAPTAARPRSGRKPTLPDFSAPQLATLVDAVPAGNGWMHEIKFDGYRALIAACGDRVRIFTRRGEDWTAKFAPIQQAMAELDLPGCLIDGEIVAYGADGNPDFSTLQAVLGDAGGIQAGDPRIGFHAFDLLEAYGEDMRPRSNIERKELLASILRPQSGPIHLADHVIGAGEKLLRTMCDAGQEGIISKRIDAAYRGGRQKNWLKVKCTRRQEFVVVGWKKSSARARPFASLLLAQNIDGGLEYRGNVGTGFNAQDMERLATQMAHLARKTPPVKVDSAAARGVSWLTPKLVAEIAFAEFTADGKVRHASYLGLRPDKRAAEVEPELPEPPSARQSVTITSRERVVFPGSGQTKGDLADYYAAIAPLLLPFAAGRPLSLVRCPQGRARKCFFQKHDNGSFGDAVLTVPLREKSGTTEDYMAIENERGILQCVQMGTIEFHGWCSRSAAPEEPDRMVFDLDPAEELDFEAVGAAALDIRDRLSELGLNSFAMLTGGKGVHVVVPLARGHSWTAHSDFARRFAQALALAEPDRFTATMSKAKRKGKIFIDWLRNQRGSTAIMPYSARAREGAPVAAPIAWNELATLPSAANWTIADAQTLLKRSRSKRLAGWGEALQDLPSH